MKGFHVDVYLKNEKHYNDKFVSYRESDCTFWQGIWFGIRLKNLYNKGKG